MSRPLVIAAILLITALSFFVFPGHTYLQQDTQIYVPILENQWRPSVLAGDLLVQHPHVNFTFYDELTYGLRWITRLPLRDILEGQQLIFRALGFWGIYLIALALGLDAPMALAVTAIWALGATITGPAVLTIEYEPTPRSFAVPLLLLACGFALRDRFLWAGIAAACAFLLHAPTTWPFWVAYVALVILRPRSAWAFLPLAVAAGLLIAAGYAQPVTEPQHFFDRLPREQEVLQRLRASYNYVSTWWNPWIGHYLLLALVALVALCRIRPKREVAVLLGGLLATGLLSVPLSWFLLEREKLAIIPQIQPARALLFVTAVAVLTSAAMGCFAAAARARIEAIAWFFFALLIPIEWPAWRALPVIAAFSLLLAFSAVRWRVALSLLLAPALLLSAGLGYRNIDSPDLAALAAWARTSTPEQSVFLFPESIRDRRPGWFRSTALRAVFVDWKGGGQVNYLRHLGSEWWQRWEAVMMRQVTPEEYRQLGINFIALPHPLAGTLAPVYRNSSWYVYRPQ